MFVSAVASRFCVFVFLIRHLQPSRRATTVYGEAGGSLPGEEHVRTADASDFHVLIVFTVPKPTAAPDTPAGVILSRARARFPQSVRERGVETITSTFRHLFNMFFRTDDGEAGSTRPHSTAPVRFWAPASVWKPRGRLGPPPFQNGDPRVSKMEAGLSARLRGGGVTMENGARTLTRIGVCASPP